jgi:hypothetical protein
MYLSSFCAKDYKPPSIIVVGNIIKKKYTVLCLSQLCNFLVLMIIDNYFMILIVKRYYLKI